MSASRIYPILKPNNGISQGLLIRWHYMTNFIQSATLSAAFLCPVLNPRLIPIPQRARTYPPTQIKVPSRLP